MIALAALPIVAIVVAAPAGPDDGCPSARQVTEAMTARFPAFVIASDTGGAAARADVLRAALDVAGDGTVVRFSLVDARGETQLRRTLPAPGRGRPVGECLALADTLAAIVERYLGTIAYDAADTRLPDVTAPPPTGDAATPVASTKGPAPSQPPSRSTFVLVGVGWRMPRGAQPPQGELEARLGGEVELNSSHPRIAGLVSVGIAQATTANLDEGRTATLRRFPARLGASIRLPAGPGWVEPALALGVDLLAISSTAGGAHPASQTFKFTAGVEAAVGYRLKIAGAFYLRPRGAFGLAIRRYDVGLNDAPEAVVFATPRAHASFGIDTGVLFQ